MSQPAQTPVNSSIANGVTTVFPYNFTIFDASDLLVMVNGVEVTSGFTISGVGNEAGGDVTFSTPPASGATVLRARDLPISRDTDYQQNGGFRADVLDQDLDRTIQILQQLNQNTLRSIKMPLDTLTEQQITENAPSRALRVLCFDASGNVTLSTLTIDELEAQPAGAAQSAIDAAASAASALAAAAAAAASYDSFDDRYLGAKATAPTVDNDGNPLITGALYFKTGSGQGMYVWNGSSWDSAASVVPDGSVTTAKIVDLAVTALKLAAGAATLAKLDTTGAVDQLLTAQGSGVAPVWAANKYLGVGQTWQSFTVGSTRVVGTTYTNSTGKPIVVGVAAADTGGAQATLTVGGVIVDQFIFSVGSFNGTFGLVGIVPPGATYVVNIAGAMTIPSWYELR
ncbi:MAG TPA: hypothetical protein VN023_09585 [Methylovorus sp.]|nr:hypothetical protein [Methylovorus sp.]